MSLSLHGDKRTNECLKLKREVKSVSWQYVSLTLGTEWGQYSWESWGPADGSMVPKTKQNKILNPLLFSEKVPSPTSLHGHTYAGIAGEHYINIFTHHIATQHMALCTSDRRHRETFTELFGHRHLLFPPGGPLTCTQHRRPIKGVVPLWKMALVTKIHKYEPVHTHWDVCTNDTVLAQSHQHLTFCEDVGKFSNLFWGINT